MRAFYDFEFLEDGFSIRPLSVGAVREDGKEYYAVFDDPATVRDAIKHPWLRKNVIPSLPVLPVDDGTFVWDANHPDFGSIRSREKISVDLRRFLDVPDPQLWAWFGAYDHVALAQLYGRMIDLPIGIPQWTNDLRQEYERLGRPIMPEQPSGIHNALEDARFNLVRAFYLDNLAERTG